MNLQKLISVQQTVYKNRFCLFKFDILYFVGGHLEKYAKSGTSCITFKATLLV